MNIDDVIRLYQAGLINSAEARKLLEQAGVLKPGLTSNAK
jgi:hypothetical protein